jgi:tetratricopeptide (TPR) repeat protein
MANSSSLRSRLRAASLGFSLIFTFLLMLSINAAGQVVGGSGFLIFGKVFLPDGTPAIRVRVKLDMATGFTRDTLTDDNGYYEFRGVNGGRYHLSATNQDAPEQHTDPADTDSTRAYANRLQVNLYLRLPLHSRKDNDKAGTVSAAEASQNIPKAAKKAYDQGLKLQKDNQPDKALVQFNQAIDLYPEYFQALTDRANLLMQQNKLTEAEADFARALKINEKYSPALRGIGFCQIQLKEFAAALRNLENAFVLEPNVPITLMLLGYANLSLNHYEEAKLCLQQALKLGPEGISRAHVYLAEVYAHEQKFKEAADEIRAFLKEKPDTSDAAQLRKMEADWRARAKTP